jgi:hypothetical protein
MSQIWTGNKNAAKDIIPTPAPQLRVAPLQQDYYTVKYLYAQVGILTDR